jgi:hypothetical protein
VRTSTTALVLSLLLSGAARAADPIPAGGIPDIVGPRSLALGASTGVAAGNEGLYVNPGAIAARKRYAIEGGALFDRRGADTVGRFFGGSIVDSESAPLTAGVSYLRAQKGLYDGNLIHFALAGPLTEGFYLGVSGKYLSVTGQSVTTTVGGTPVQTKLADLSAVTADAGILWQVASLVSVGAAGYNLVPVGNKLAAPLGMGAGVGIGSDRSFQVTADWRTDFDAPAGKNATRYAAGAEALLFDMVPVRAGWMKDGLLDTSWWSAGIGIVTPTGVALDFGYRQSVDDPSARMIGATLKLFVNVAK